MTENSADRCLPVRRREPCARRAADAGRLRARRRHRRAGRTAAGRDDAAGCRVSDRDPGGSRRRARVQRRRTTGSARVLHGAGQRGADDHRALAAGVRAARRAAGRDRRIAHRSADCARHAGERARSPASRQPAAANGRIHIIDARDSDEPIRAIQFDWQSPDGASQAKVSIEASDDLDRWRVLVPASTLLLATRGEQELKRERIELPAQAYDYLRVQRTDGGPPLAIAGVTRRARRRGRRDRARRGSWRRTT